MQVLRCSRFLGTLFVWNTILWLQLLVTRSDQRDAVRARTQRAACRRLRRILDVSVDVVAPDVPDVAYLTTVNHLGVLDSIVLASVLDVAFVGKADIIDWPGIGWVTRTVGLIPVQRDRRMAAADFVGRVRNRLARNVSVLVFPEGTTSNGEAVRPFKTGVFEAVVGLAEQMILPVGIAYTAIDGRPSSRADERRLTWSDDRVSMIAHCWAILGFRGVTAEVRIGQPIVVGQLSRRELATIVHAEVSSLRAQTWTETPQATSIAKYPRSANSD